MRIHWLTWLQMQRERGQTSSCLQLCWGSWNTWAGEEKVRQIKLQDLAPRGSDWQKAWLKANAATYLWASSSSLTALSTAFKLLFSSFSTRVASRCSTSATLNINTVSLGATWRALLKMHQKDIVKLLTVNRRLQWRMKWTPDYIYWFYLEQHLLALLEFPTFEERPCEVQQDLSVLIFVKFLQAVLVLQSR